VVKYHGLAHRYLLPASASGCGRSLTAVRWADRKPSKLTMGHALQPAAGTLPPLEEIVARLAGEFHHVRVDREAALREARSQAAWIRGANPTIFLGRHADALAQAALLESITLDRVLWVEFGDDPNETRNFFLWPGEVIKFGYRDPEDERMAHPLLVRCARVLECDLTPF
jgi:hypothetical protein